MMNNNNFFLIGREVNEVMVNKLGKNGIANVKPLMIAVNDTEAETDRRLIAICSKLTRNGWNATQARYGVIICDLLGKDILVNDITTRHVEAIRDYLIDECGNSVATVNRYYSSLSKMLKYAFNRPNEYGLSSIPHIEWEKENNGRIRWVDKKEEDKMVEIMTNRNAVDYLNFFLFLIDTGLRKSEALRLKKCDVQTDAISKTQYVIVHESKNGEKRSVPLCMRAKEIVQNLTRHMEEDDSIFQLNYWTVQNQWDAMRELMGLEADREFTLHALRHTYASRLAQSGKVDFHKISVLMGHKTLAMTKRYSHLMPQHTFSVVDVLDNDRSGNTSGSLIDIKSHKG
tara:strand:+ start:528 stop:1556 length:1029 start_codon:yes stop_codon:yes gene_type:complete